jgi:hypothetical protein
VRPVKSYWHSPERTVRRRPAGLQWPSLRRGGIELRRADRPLRAGGRNYPAGTYVIGPPQRPYDMTGYELSLKMGVRVDRVTELFPLPAAEVPEIDIPAPAGAVHGAGQHGFLLSGTTTERTWEAINRILVGYAAERGVENGRKVRTDATVTEMNIHYPTDSSLLWDCVRVITRLRTRAPWYDTRRRGEADNARIPHGPTTS